jgi:anti-sigma B factor antagonist
MDNLTGTDGATPNQFVGTSEGNGKWSVTVSGEVDLDCADGFKAVVEQVLEQNPREVVFDLSEVRFIDSSGLAVLVDAANRVPVVTVRSPSPAARRVIEISGLAPVLGLQT